jgi:hypothetical protein
MFNGDGIIMEGGQEPQPRTAYGADSGGQLAPAGEQPYACETVPGPKMTCYPRDAGCQFAPWRRSAR